MAEKIKAVSYGAVDVAVITYRMLFDKGFLFSDTDSESIGGIKL